MTHSKNTYHAHRSGNFYTQSLQYKILFPFITLMIITGGVISFVSYHYSVKTTTEELSQNVETQMVSMNDTFEIFFSNIDSTLNRLTSNRLLIDYNDKNNVDIIELFKHTVDTDRYVANLYTGIDNGETIIYPVTDLGEDFNPKERIWYKNAIEANGEIIWTEPYIDAATGEVVVTAAKAYGDENQFDGVVAADIYVNTLIEIVNKITIGETGYAVIYDNEGKYLAHPNENFIGKDESSEPYYQEIHAKDAQGVIEYTSSGKKTIMGFSKNDTTGWILGGTVYKGDFERRAQTIIVPISITFISLLLIGITVSFLSIKKVTTAIQIVMERMKLIASGNLSKPQMKTNSHDEVGQLVHATNDMNDQMRYLLQQISQVSETMSSQSEEFTQSANEVQQGANQVASTVQEIAAGAETQANHASNLASNMQTFASEIDGTKKEGISIQKTSQDAVKISAEGTELMISSQKQMDKIDKIVHDAVKKVNGLDKQSQTISQLINVIQDIAEQTNLLALNAAIEAARAGEQGQGFSVVADEVRKLAEQVSHSVTDITDIVSTIQKESSIVSKSLELGYKEVEEGTKQIEITNKKFEAIQDSFSNMVKSIQTVSNSIEIITKQSEQMNNDIENIAAISEESAAGIEQTSASTQQASGAMDEIARSSNDLAKLAETLNGLVNRFKL